MEKKLLFVINLKAGKRKSHSAFFDAVEVFCQHGYAVNVHSTTGRGDATEYTKEHASEYDLVVCCGGDGTLNETINGIVQCKSAPPIGYIPAGSTNDFATSLGLSGDIVEAARRIVEGKENVLDVGKFNDRIFSYVASFGAFTKVSYSAPQEIKNLFGHMAYLIEGAKDISSLHRYSIKITADGRKLDGDYLFGAVANSTSIAGLLHLPHELVSMTDGAFELFLVKMPQNPIELQGLIGCLMVQDLSNKCIVLEHVKNVSIKSNEPLSWSLDGEFVMGKPKDEIVCLPRLLHIIS